METKTEINFKNELISKFKNRNAKIGIIGLGYVGLPLAVCKAKVGFNIIGFDRLKNRTDMVNTGESYISDVKNEELAELIKKKKISATTDFSLLSTVDAIIICVPTPLTQNRDPDISYVKNVTQQIAKYLKKSQLIVLESTTYPGTTQEILLPMLEKDGFKAGKDFYLVFSPERVDPGNSRYNTHNTNKILGGITKDCTEVGMALYEQSIIKIVSVSSPTAAEMVKIFENTFRSVNIALVNELAILCDKMHLNIWEVLDAAATKPFGIMSFYPGPGVGGHCIPIDPFYLTWKAREYNFHTRFIELAGEINAYMPIFVKEKVSRALNSFKKAINGSNILILGVAYKKDISDSRESPAEKIIELLIKADANIIYNDPFVPEYKVNEKIFKSIDLTDDIWDKADCTVIVSEHSCYDYDEIVRKSKVVVDTRNSTKNVAENRDKIILL